ncbi:hypothetical protein GRI39_01850 [Altererythrobacter indicus]|uniref:Uncharacterized protein n=1 Tax=Altericroceibacterium indicum TaxID=374177 RepID=A0A845A609_9SPHN|nr:hypothetical protein [Altericroceibacterium indicum]MXP24789.1 hypothetical protein [Altericroceibacterium indicum]
MLDRNWQTAPATDLEAAIAEFKTTLPGWWFSVCECQVSCDASCAPTSESDHIKLIPFDDRFDSGFHIDFAQPATLAEVLREVMRQGVAAVAACGGGE